MWTISLAATGINGPGDGALSQTLSAPTFLQAMRSARSLLAQMEKMVKERGEDLYGMEFLLTVDHSFPTSIQSDKSRSACDPFNDPLDQTPTHAPDCTQHCGGSYLPPLTIEEENEMFRR